MAEAAGSATTPPPPLADSTSNAQPRRHAEKQRESTCRFADAVAEAALGRFREVVGTVEPELAGALRGEAGQTVVAAVLVQCGERLEVVAVGAGTRVLPDAEVARQEESGEAVGDMHGEVLARRALVALVLDEMKQLRGAPAPVGTRTRLLEIVPDDACAEPRQGTPHTHIHVRSDVVIHVYTSSAPCGNAVVRRWARPPKKDTLDESLGTWEWPRRAHPPFSAAQRAEGQCAVLCKVDPARVSSSAAADASGASEKRARTAAPSDSSSVEKEFPPPGTARSFNASLASSRATCSDKLARWCALGMEGALVRAGLCPRSASLRPATVTIGRKFCRPHVERALCCRVAEWYRAHGDEPHPVSLVTAVKLHEGGYDAATGASFSPVCLVWRAGAAAQVLDARTGRVWGTNAASLASRASLWGLAHAHGGDHDAERFSAAAYTAAKARAPPAYVADVDQFLTRYLPDWPRRRHW